MFFSFLCTLCLFPFNVLPSPPFHRPINSICVTEKKCEMHTKKYFSVCLPRLGDLKNMFSNTRKMHSQDNSSATKIFQGTRTITGINMGEKVAQVNIETLNVVYFFMPPPTLSELKVQKKILKNLQTDQVDTTERKETNNVTEVEKITFFSYFHFPFFSHSFFLSSSTPRCHRWWVNFLDENLSFPTATCNLKRSTFSCCVDCWLLLFNRVKDSLTWTHWRLSRRIMIYSGWGW